MITNFFILITDNISISVPVTEISLMSVLIDCVKIWRLSHYRDYNYCTSTHG